MVKTIKYFGKATFLALSLAAIIVGVALAAGSVTLAGYQVDFLGFQQTGDTSTWTYAVTASGDEANGLSHWTLELASCYDIVAPANGSTYTTVTGITACTDGTYDCQAAEYTVVHGNDPTTSISGIKFEDPDPALSSANPKTHIFEITLQFDGTHSVADVGIGVKAGQSQPTGVISGPACVPTAVSLASFGQGKSSNVQVGAFLAFAGALSLVGGLVVQRNWKKSK